MKKYFSLILAVLLIVSLTLAFASCNNDGDTTELNRETIVNDFVVLGLGKIDPSYKATMTEEEVLALENPVAYIIAKHSLKFAGGILNATNIRVQKLASVNAFVSSSLNLNEENSTPTAYFEQFFNLLTNAGLTSEDIGDLVYTVFDYTANNAAGAVTALKTELTTFKESLSADKFSSAEKYQTVLSEADDMIKEVTNIETTSVEVLTADVKTAIAEAKQPLTVLFDSVAKVSMTSNNSFLSLGGAVTEIKDETPIPQGESRRVKYQFNATADEIASYFSGLKTNAEQIIQEFSGEKWNSLNNALGQISMIAERLPIVPSPVIFSVDAAISSLNFYNMFSGYLPRALGAIDANLINDYMRLNNDEVDISSSSIIMAKLTLAAIGNETAATVKANIDSYYQGMSQDKSIRIKQMIALANIVGSNTAQGETAFAMIFFKSYLRDFKQCYDAYKNGAETYKGGTITEALDLYSSSVIEKKESIGADINIEGLTKYSQEWYDEIYTKCENKINEILDSAVTDLIANIKAKIDDFFTNKLSGYQELAAMPLQTSSGEKFARLTQLNELLDLEYANETLFKYDYNYNYN